MKFDDNPFRGYRSVMRIQTEKYNEAKRRICEPSLRKGQAVMRQQLTYQPNTEALSRNHFCRGKAINITYSECVFVALGFQHATRMRHIFICGLAGRTTFFHINVQTVRFARKKVLNTESMFWFSLQLLLDTFSVLRRNEPDMMKDVCLSSCKVPMILVIF
jgi:hypothetical protein